MGVYIGRAAGFGRPGHGRLGLGRARARETLRYGADGKPVVTDGPFAETKEQVAGYVILECEDLGEALGWVERMPVRGGSLEVREIVDSAG